MSNPITEKDIIAGIKLVALKQIKQSFKLIHKEMLESKQNQNEN